MSILRKSNRVRIQTPSVARTVEESSGFPPFGPDPTHLIVFGNVLGGSAISIVDDTNLVVRSLVTGRQEIGRGFVDYTAQWVYWVEKSAVSGDAELHRIDFDGSNEVTLIDFAASGDASAGNHVHYDSAIGKLILCRGDSFIYTANKDGSGLTLVETASARESVSPFFDGVHYLDGSFSSPAIRKVRLSDGGTAAAKSDGNWRFPYYDPWNEKIYAIRTFSNAGRLSQMDPDFTNEVVIATDLPNNGGSYYAVIEGRWIYYTTNVPSIVRRNLDSITTSPEVLFTFASRHYWPWVEP